MYGKNECRFLLIKNITKKEEFYTLQRSAVIIFTDTTARFLYLCAVFRLRHITILPGCAQTHTRESTASGSAQPTVTRFSIRNEHQL